MAAINSPAPFIGGYRLLDGNAVNKSLANPLWSTQQSVAVVAGQTSQSTGVPMNATVNNVTANVAGGTVVLPPAVPGDITVIFNRGSGQTLTVAGFLTTDTVDGGASVSLSSGNAAMYWCLTSGVWISNLLGAASS